METKKCIIEILYFHNSSLELLAAMQLVYKDNKTLLSKEFWQKETLSIEDVKKALK